MLLLTCDTAQRQASLALCNEAMVIQVRFFLAAGENIATELQYLLQQANYQLNDIDLFVVTSGPGSFTGLRVGLNFMKTLAHLQRKPLVGVPTLQAMSYDWLDHPQLKNYHIVPTIHSSQDEYYAAIYNCDSPRQLLTAPALHQRSALLARLPAHSFIFGLGVERLLNTTLPSQAAGWWVESASLPATPKAIAQLGLAAFRRQQGLLHITSQPNYLRVSAAEQKRGINNPTYG